MRQDPYRLDTGTTERLLGGSILVDDAPPRYRRVVRALGRLRASTSVARRTCEPAMAARLADEVVREVPRPSAHGPGRSVRLAAAGLLGALVTFSGLAAANALPDVAQRTASELLSRVGVHVPDPETDTPPRPGPHGASGAHQAPAGTTGKGKGTDISGLAHTTDSTGVDKGAEISTDASGGKSQAGQHGAAGSAPPASVPRPTGASGGPGSTAHTAPSPPGASTADTASGGHSSAGSANGDQGTTHKP
jgi:hypothetical protein